MLSVLVGAVVVAEEVLGMVGRGTKPLVGCHPRHERALVEALAVLMGVMGTEGLADLHPLHIPLLRHRSSTSHRALPPPSRTHSLVHAWLHPVFLSPW